jgi:hypothetical protein
MLEAARNKRVNHGGKASIAGTREGLKRGLD